jgi:DNA end-binding protein Ku
MFVQYMVRFYILNRANWQPHQEPLYRRRNRKASRGDEVKGYERGEGDYVMLEEDELDSVALESTRTIDICLSTQNSGDLLRR